ncbi:hypothetical protein GCM10010094_28180 [Streptomyces flaveus]|uniref:Uncharacterized protein n=1 Tax=Streptomyces flaveus TaxID=66370 RepID=A0A917VCY1_9ACTN|nr:hypothetical protein GCM10010094_28180 [Streptomyces flaveus]
MPGVSYGGALGFELPECFADLARVAASERVQQVRELLGGYREWLFGQCGGDEVSKYEADGHGLIVPWPWPPRGVPPALIGLGGRGRAGVRCDGSPATGPGYRPSRRSVGGT